MSPWKMLMFHKSVSFQARITIKRHTGMIERNNDRNNVGFTMLAQILYATPVLLFFGFCLSQKG